MVFKLGFRLLFVKAFTLARMIRQNRDMRQLDPRTI
jgi:hypothetical protein